MSKSSLVGILIFLSCTSAFSQVGATPAAKRETLAPASQGQLTAPSKVQKLTRQFHRTMMTCPQKIWHDFNWDQVQIFFVYPSKANSWGWDATGNYLKPVPTNTLPPHWLQSLFYFTEANQKKILSLNMEFNFGEGVDLGESFTFQLGVHEVFHFVGQSGWHSHSHGGGRGTQYPARWEPRLYRRMIFDNLKRYLENGQAQELGRARHWFDKWTSEFPEETASTTDGYEGTAKYVDIMAKVIAKKGCSISEQSLKSEVLTGVQTGLGRTLTGERFSLDAEGYEVGGLAALILRLRHSDMKAWTERAKMGETPLEVLLERITPLAEAAPRDLVATFRKSAAAVNLGFSADLDPSIKNWSDRSYIRMSAPVFWLQGNLIPKYFAHAKSLNRDVYVLNSPHQYTSQTGQSAFQLPGGVVLFKEDSNPCREAGTFVLVPESELPLDRIAKGAASQFGKLKGQVLSNHEGYRYLCLE